MIPYIWWYWPGAFPCLNGLKQAVFQLKKQGLLFDRHGPAKCGLLDDSNQLCKTCFFFNLPSNV
jgi:hypothetical protein